MAMTSRLAYMIVLAVCIDNEKKDATIHKEGTLEVVMDLKCNETHISTEDAMTMEFKKMWLM